MKNHFNFLSTTLIVALSFAASQASWGMDVNNDEKINQSKISPKKPVPWKTEIEWRKFEKVGEFSKLPKFLTQKILNMAIYQQAIEDGEHPIDIELTCKTFRSILAQDTKDFNTNLKLNEKDKSLLPFNTRLAFFEGLKVHYNITTQDQIAVFNRIYNGKLIYKPDPNSDNMKIELLISALKHPFQGEFSLVKCDNTGEYLSINMGYRKRMNPKNARKIEIWIAPRFLIERERNTTAGHFEPTMKNWDTEKAHVGIFFTWGGWENLDRYDYSTTESMDEMSSRDLYQKYMKKIRGWAMVTCARRLKNFHISFVN